MVTVIYVTCREPWDIETQSPYLSDVAVPATSSGPITMTGALVDGVWFCSVWIQFLGYSTVIVCKGWWLIHTKQPYLPLSTELEGTWDHTAPSSQCPLAHEVWQQVYLTTPWMLRCSFVYKGEWTCYQLAIKHLSDPDLLCYLIHHKAFQPTSGPYAFRHSLFFFVSTIINILVIFTQIFTACKTPLSLCCHQMLSPNPTPVMILLELTGPQCISWKNCLNVLTACGGLNLADIRVGVTNPF